jgi:hypothetical protein
MRHIPRCAALLALAVLTLPLLAADPPDKGKKTTAKKDAETPQNTEKMIKTGQVIGKIMAIVESKKTIRLQVQMPVPNVNAINALAQAQFNLQSAMARGDRNGVFNAQRSIMQHQANLITYQPKDYEFQAIDDIKVRLNNPPVQFDDKGRPKKYTAKELKELKGNDPKLPGYQGEFGDLKQDQIVQVTLVKKKDAPRQPVKKGKDAEADLLADHLPEISMVLVLAEPKN